MNRDELVAFLRARCDEMIATIKDKNHDYTGGHADPFFNFRAVELLDICDIETGMMARITDKLMRVRSFVKLGMLKVKTESVVDTLCDASAYFLLLAAVVETKRRQAGAKGPLLELSYWQFTRWVQGECGSEERTVKARVTKRASDDWVMTFDDATLDCMRAATSDELLKLANKAHGPLTLAKEPKL